MRNCASLGIFRMGGWVSYWRYFGRTRLDINLRPSISMLPIERLLTYWRYKLHTRFPSDLTDDPGASLYEAQDVAAAEVERWFLTTTSHQTAQHLGLRNTKFAVLWEGSIGDAVVMWSRSLLAPPLHFLLLLLLSLKFPRFCFSYFDLLPLSKGLKSSSSPVTTAYYSKAFLRWYCEFCIPKSKVLSSSIGGCQRSAHYSRHSYFLSIVERTWIVPWVRWGRTAWISSHEQLSSLILRILDQRNAIGFQTGSRSKLSCI